MGVHARLEALATIAQWMGKVGFELQPLADVSDALSDAFSYHVIKGNV